ncbi:cytochrome P450 [Dactylosporangium sp. CA-139066]|uniref:cytochrome P450 n=1 Tax=Dactylosporangium sp. CA-139066 TaxID=3239930 RepID=UPI003D935DD9
MTTQAGPTDVDVRAEQVFFEFLGNPPDVEPYASYRWFHEHAPVFRGSNGMIVLSRFADVDAVLRHRDMGRGEESVQHLTDLPPRLLEPVMRRWKRTMVFANPPLHTKMRRKVGAQFLPRHVEAMRELVARRARETMDALADSPGADFVTTVASPLGGAAVADLLGVPEDDRAELARLSPRSMGVFDPMTATSDLEAAAAAEITMADYFADALEERRTAPRDDLLTRLVAPADGDPLEPIEMVAAAANLTNAGNDTTTNLLSNSMYALLTHPEQLRRLREHPELVPRAVEELARFDPPLNLNPRTALVKTTVAGLDLEPGEIVVGIQGAANRDPRRYTDPDALDLGRDEGVSLAFGGGAHFCMGAHLGRLVMSEFLTCLITRFSGAEPAATPRRRPGHNLRGFAELPVRLSR